MTAYPKQPLFRRAAASLLVAAALAAAWAGPSVASSHREAPFIATQPQVDAHRFLHVQELRARTRRRT